MLRRRIAVPVAAAILGLLLTAPACSSNTKNDIKSVGSDLSTDANKGASELSSDASSGVTRLSTDLDTQSSSAN